MCVCVWGGGRCIAIDDKDSILGSEPRPQMTQDLREVLQKWVEMKSKTVCSSETGFHLQRVVYYRMARSLSAVPQCLYSAKSAEIA